MTEENRARWRAGLEARARANAEYDGIEYELALIREMVNRNQRIVDYMEAHHAFIMAIAAIPDYLVSAEEKWNHLEKSLDFLPDGLNDYIQEERSQVQGF